MSNEGGTRQLRKQEIVYESSVGALQNGLDGQRPFVWT